jgi:hypothetical protein
MENDRYFCPIFTKTELYLRMSVTESRTKFDGHVSTGNRILPNGRSVGRSVGRTDGWTDTGDEADSRFSPVCERTRKSETSIISYSRFRMTKGKGT